MPEIQSEDPTVYGTLLSQYLSISKPIKAAKGAVKCIVTDMDGTFLDAHHSVDDRTIDAYKKLVAAGYRVIPCTGRSLYAVKRVLEQNVPEFASVFALTPGIYLNGVSVFGGSLNEEVVKFTIPNAKVIKIFRIFYETKKTVEKQNNVSLEICSYCNHLRGIVMDFMTEFDSKWLEAPGEPVNAQLDVFLTQNPHAYQMQQINLAGPPSDIAQLYNYMVGSPETMFQIAQCGVRLLNPVAEVLSFCILETSKASGISVLSKCYNFSKSNIVAIGDGDNDIEMISECAYSAAMGNAIPRLKEIADIVVSQCDQGGWAEAVNRLVFQ